MTCRVKCTDWFFAKSCNNLKCLFLLNMVLVLMIQTVDIFLIKRSIAFNSNLIHLFPYGVRITRTYHIASQFQEPIYLLTGSTKYQGLDG